MSTAHVSNARATQNLSVEVVDSKLEVVAIPVADVERAKRFYRNLGWRLDADFAFDNGVRVVQFTPPGSQCSIQFGANMTTSTPGSAQGLYLIVSDIEAARDELAAPKHHWSDWYAAYIVARERGKTPDDAAEDAALNVERTRGAAPQ